MTTKRDCKKEYREYHGKPEQIAARSQRNAARAKLGLAVGNPKECDQKTRLAMVEAIERTISELWQGAQTARRELNNRCPANFKDSNIKNKN